MFVVEPVGTILQFSWEMNQTIHELEPTQFSKVGHLYRGHKQNLPVFAVIEGNFPGRVFVDNPDEPQAALVWAVGRWSYVGGDAGSPIFERSLAEFVKQIIIPDSLSIEQNWFEIYAPYSDDWMQMLQSCLGVFDLSRHLESVFLWDKQKYIDYRSRYSFPPETAIEQVEVPILPQRARQAPFVAEEFRTRGAICFRLRVDDRVVAQCRSNGFAVGDEFMIDVETFSKDQRGKGYATAAGVALLDHCLEHGLVPLWETTEDNATSRRLAVKLGFVEDETYPVYCLEF